MHKREIGICLTAFLFINLLVGCSDWDYKYSTNPNHTLSFSHDTLSFDTVFTTIGSATRQIMVYNTNTQPLKISSIHVENGSQTGFRINVDGRTGDSFSDITILDKDSLFVLVEVNVDPTQSDSPLLIEDKIKFITNGTSQQINLQACGQDVHIMKGGYIFTQDTLLAANRPYLIYDSIRIASGTKTRIEPGATFYMHDKAKWIIEGTLEAEGTQESPILFRGDRLDDMVEGKYPYDRIPAQWDGMRFTAESYANRMEYVIMRNSTNGIELAESTPEELKLTIRQSQFTNSSETLLSATHCRVEASGTEFSNAGGALVRLTGGSYRFSHCTLVNYMRLRTRTETSVVLSNHSTGDNNIISDYPLQEALFENCIIDGSYSVGSQPLGGELSIQERENIPLNYQFHNCVIKTMEISDARFSQVLFKKSPTYLSNEGSNNNFRYDFRLFPEEGVATGKADPEISLLYPTDRYGVNRLGHSHGPDIGAYQSIETKEE